MAAPHPYFLFAGTARGALSFYQQVFGGELTLHSFGDFGRDDGPADAVAHGILEGTVSVFAADSGLGETSFTSTGLMFSLLGVAEPAQLHAWFEALSDGGDVVDALQLRPWGGTDGQVVDRFGVKWLIGYEGA